MANQFRIFIDIPLGDLDETAAAELTQKIANRVHEGWKLDAPIYFRESVNQPTEINFRLGNDEDRQKSNYLIKSPSGHVSTKKSEIPLFCE